MVLLDMEPCVMQCGYDSVNKVWVDPVCVQDGGVDPADNVLGDAGVGNFFVEQVSGKFGKCFSYGCVEGLLGVDEDVCNGDHACMRLSGCPTLTLKDNPDPLKVDPVATVIDGCVGCGLCGENAHAATLCPSFYRAEVIQNPRWHERIIAALRSTVLRVLQPA